MKPGDVITTTAGQSFTWEDACDLARLVRKRFGGTIPGAIAWRRLHENNCPDGKFDEMAEVGDLRHETQARPRSIRPSRWK